MPLVPRVGHCFEELGEPRQATDVFGRAGAGAGETRRVGDLRRRFERFLDLDGVPPVVAEVVPVVQFLVAIVDELAQEDFGFFARRLVNFVELFHRRHFDPLVTGAEFVQVAVLPPQRDLDDFVEHVERAVGNVEASPDERSRSVEGDLDLVVISGRRPG